MANKWVDNTEYFGPDRRRRPASKRWGERRRDDEAGQIPPLGALLRRLRVQMLGITRNDDHIRALQLLNGAISEASRLGYRQCATALQAADRALREHGPKGVTIADTKILEAMDHAGGAR